MGEDMTRNELADMVTGGKNVSRSAKKVLCFDEKDYEIISKNKN